ncbi:hypothetical protein R3P38DRAFT_3342738 [Favolaschia claudopus]|uniref:Uncharacterized protein n=1 Tax=Favolaschia claudopus TaxID=2862362 RepID=A0AAW0DT65_9AGAR
MNMNTVGVDPRNEPSWVQFRHAVAADLAVNIALLERSESMLGLPLDFPHNLRKVLNVGGTAQAPNLFQYRLKYCDPARDDEHKAAAWIAYGARCVRGSREFLIGVVRIDPLIYQDPGSLHNRLASGHLMLHLMREAVLQDRWICVEFVVHPVMGRWGEIHSAEERIVARAYRRGWELCDVVEEYRRRRVPPRFCNFRGVGGCAVLLPVVGPEHCARHVPGVDSALMLPRRH